MIRQVLTVAEMARADAAAIAAGTPGLELMERAGTAVADAVCARFARQAALVLCGPGNNGGDGYVAARVLKERGWPVEVRAFGEPATQDAQAAARRWDGADQAAATAVSSRALDRRPVRRGPVAAAGRAGRGGGPAHGRGAGAGGGGRHAQRRARRHRQAARPGGLRRR